MNIPTIRVGIELNHVIRNINYQIAKYYQKEYNADYIDLDTIDCKDDILNDICKFNTQGEKLSFLYENYPLEIFGHANQFEWTLSRDLNKWMMELTNVEDYNIEIFFYSMRELGLTIPSTYYFLSKIASHVRKMIFPKNVDELMDCGDVFVTANNVVIDRVSLCDSKKCIKIKTHSNQSSSNADYEYESFNDFINDSKKLQNIVSEKEWKSKKNPSSTTWMPSWISSLWTKISW